MRLALERAVEQRGFVEHVGQVCAGVAGGLLGDGLEVDARGHGLALGVDLQDLVAADHVRRFHADLAVEAARTQQCRVQDVGAVGGGDQDDVGLDVEAVHFHQQLVEGLLAFVVAAADAGAAVAANGVDFVNEDDGGRVGLGLFEQVTDAGRADTDEHLNEVRAGDGEEGNARLAGDGAGQEGLAGAGRAVQQHTLGDLGADRLELGRFLQELLDFLEFLDGFISAGDVHEGHLRHVLVDHLGLGLAELHDLRTAALHAGHQEPEQRAEEDDGDQEREESGEPVALDRLVGVAACGFGVGDGLDHVHRAGIDEEELDALALVLPVDLEVVLEHQVHAVFAVEDLRLLNLVVGQQPQALVRVDPGGTAGSQCCKSHKEHADHNNDPDARALEETLSFHLFGDSPRPSW